MFKKLFKAKVKNRENITYQLFDKDGNAKTIWSNNFIGEAIMRLIRRFVGSSHKIAREGLRIPFLTGLYLYSVKGANLITTTGKAGMASRCNGSGSEAAFTYIALGSGTTAAAVGDTTLETEITTNGGERSAATVSRVTTDTTDDTARMVESFTFSGALAITEAGVLNAASVGVLLNRQVFTVVNVVLNDVLQVTVDIDID